MNYSTIFLISITCIATNFYANAPTLTQPTIKTSLSTTKTPSEIEKEIDVWLQNYFAKKLFKDDVTYTPDLFNRIKQHLLSHGYIQYVPHKELKKTIKNRIVDLHRRKHLTDKWISKYKKSIKATVASYHHAHPKTKPQNILEYLNTCKNKTCKQVQQALQNQDFLPELIKQTIKKIITEVQK